MRWEEQRDEFEKMVEELQELLINKGREYAGDKDALGNFKSANELGVTPLQKLGIFLSKHQASINSYIANGKIYSNEPIEGRINDCINYLFLLRCLIKDLQREQNGKETLLDGKENKEN